MAMLNNPSSPGMPWPRRPAGTIPRRSKPSSQRPDFLANNRVVFNISGNKYRLVVKVDYDFQVIFIRFIGSHAEYDKVDASII